MSFFTNWLKSTPEKKSSGEAAASPPNNDKPVIATSSAADNNPSFATPNAKGVSSTVAAKNHAVLSWPWYVLSVQQLCTDVPEALLSLDYNENDSSLLLAQLTRQVDASTAAQRRHVIDLVGGAIFANTLRTDFKRVLTRAALGIALLQPRNNDGVQLSLKNFVLGGIPPFPTATPECSNTHLLTMVCVTQTLILSEAKLAVSPTAQRTSVDSSFSFISRLLFGVLFCRAPDHNEELALSASTSSQNAIVFDSAFVALLLGLWRQIAVNVSGTLDSYLSTLGQLQHAILACPKPVRIVLSLILKKFDSETFELNQARQPCSNQAQEQAPPLAPFFRLPDDREALSGWNSIASVVCDTYLTRLSDSNNLFSQSSSLMQKNADARTGGSSRLGEYLLNVTPTLQVHLKKIESLEHRTQRAREILSKVAKCHSNLDILNCLENEISLAPIPLQEFTDADEYRLIKEHHVKYALQQYALPSVKKKPVNDDDDDSDDEKSFIPSLFPGKSKPKASTAVNKASRAKGEFVEKRFSMSEISKFFRLNPTEDTIQITCDVFDFDAQKLEHCASKRISVVAETVTTSWLNRQHEQNVKDAKIVFSVSGEPPKEQPKRKDAPKVATVPVKTKTPTVAPDGKDGENGVAGLPGQSGGRILFFVANNMKELYDSCSVQFLADGSIGGKGGDGGNASDGGRGLDGEDGRYDTSSRSWCYSALYFAPGGAAPVARGRGGKGGGGGIGGFVGIQGKIHLFDLRHFWEQDFSENGDISFHRSPRDGEREGESGKPGNPGLGGDNGKRGLDVQYGEIVRTFRSPLPINETRGYAYNEASKKFLSMEELHGELNNRGYVAFGSEPNKYFLAQYNFFSTTSLSGASFLSIRDKKEFETSEKNSNAFQGTAVQVVAQDRQAAKKVEDLNFDKILASAAVSGVAQLCPNLANSLANAGMTSSVTSFYATFYNLRASSVSANFSQSQQQQQSALPFADSSRHKLDPSRQKKVTRFDLVLADSCFLHLNNNSRRNCLDKLRQIAINQDSTSNIAEWIALVRKNNSNNKDLLAINHVVHVIERSSHLQHSETTLTEVNDTSALTTIVAGSSSSLQNSSGRLGSSSSPAASSSALGNAITSNSGSSLSSALDWKSKLWKKVEEHFHQGGTSNDLSSKTAKALEVPAFAALDASLYEDIAPSFQSSGFKSADSILRLILPSKDNIPFSRNETIFVVATSKLIAISCSLQQNYQKDSSSVLIDLRSKCKEMLVVARLIDDHVSEEKYSASHVQNFSAIAKPVHEISKLLFPGDTERSLAAEVKTHTESMFQKDFWTNLFRKTSSSVNELQQCFKNAVANGVRLPLPLLDDLLFATALVYNQKDEQKDHDDGTMNDLSNLCDKISDEIFKELLLISQSMIAVTPLQDLLDCRDRLANDLTTTKKQNPLDGAYQTEDDVFVPAKGPLRKDRETSKFPVQDMNVVKILLLKLLDAQHRNLTVAKERVLSSASSNSATLGAASAVFVHNRFSRLNQLTSRHPASAFVMKLHSRNQLEKFSHNVVDKTSLILSVSTLLNRLWTPWTRERDRMTDIPPTVVVTLQKYLPLLIDQALELLFFKLVQDPNCTIVRGDQLGNLVRLLSLEHHEATSDKTQFWEKHLRDRLHDAPFGRWMLVLCDCELERFINSRVDQSQQNYNKVFLACSKSLARRSGPSKIFHIIKLLDRCFSEKSMTMEGVSNSFLEAELWPYPADFVLQGKFLLGSWKPKEKTNKVQDLGTDFPWLLSRPEILDHVREADRLYDDLHRRDVSLADCVSFFKTAFNSVAVQISDDDPRGANHFLKMILDGITPPNTTSTAASSRSSAAAASSSCSLGQLLAWLSRTYYHCSLLEKRRQQQKLPGIRARPFQLAVVAALLCEPCANLARIKTGEGKTLIVAFIAAVRAITGYNVDIVTANKDLALQGFYINRKFFTAVLPTKEHVVATSVPKPNKHNGQEVVDSDAYNHCIVYSVVSVLSSDAIKSKAGASRPGWESRSKPGYRFLILDEVDSILLDHFGDVLYRAQEVDNLKLLQPLLAAIWAKVCGCNGDPKMVEQIVTATETEIAANMHGIPVSQDVQQYCFSHAKHFVHSAFDAFSMSPDHHFIIDNNSNNNASVSSSALFP